MSGPPRACPDVSQGALDFPDEVVFEQTTVKATASQSFLVRNVGTKATGFQLMASHPFDVQPAAGHLAVGELLQVRPRTTAVRSTQA